MVGYVSETVGFCSEQFAIEIEHYGKLLTRHDLLIGEYNIAVYTYEYNGSVYYIVKKNGFVTDCLRIMENE